LSKKRVFLLVLTPIIVLAVGGGGGLALLTPRNDHLVYGLIVGDAPVGGMSGEEAKSKVAPLLESRLDQEITWRYEERSWRFPLKQLGLGWDLDESLGRAMEVGRKGTVAERVNAILRAATGSLKIEPTLVLDRRVADDALGRLAELVSREPANAYLSLNGDEVVIQPQKSGTELDMEAVRTQMEEIVAAGHSGDYPLPVKLKQPRVTTGDLAGIECVLGGYTTNFIVAKLERSHNIRVATAALNGAVIAPGEVFSFNAVVGPRSNERGYKSAPIYERGKVVPGVGGGVCQVSSTTYNAFLLAGFEIVQRSNHAMPVVYVPAGRDATVVHGVIDLKVRNPFPNPTYLMAGVNGGTVWVKVLGKRSDKMEVSVSSTVTGRIPFSVIEEEDPSLPPGKIKVDQRGTDGKSSVTYRKINKPGEPERSEVVSRDRYHPMNKIILEGPKAVKEEKPAPPTEAGPAGPPEMPAVGSKAPTNGSKAPTAPRKASTAKAESPEN